MAGFEVTLYGRFWVTPEATISVDHSLACGSWWHVHVANSTLSMRTNHHRNALRCNWWVS